MVSKYSESLVALLCPKREPWRLQGLICVVLLLCAPAPDLLGEALWAGLGPGSYQVGYRVEQMVDSSRRFSDTTNGQRPIQISLWYPASSIEGRPRVTWKDYVLSADRELGDSPPDESRQGQHLDELREASLGSGGDPDLIASFLELETIAYHEAPAANERSPLVVFIPGHSAPAFQNTVAYEYLASAGFVVASFPSMGATGREMTSDEAGASAQVSDIEFVLKAAADLPPSDPERAALVGYSWGGMSAMLAAMKGVDAEAIDAVIAIDPTLMVKKGHALARTFEDYQPESLQIPVMLMIAAALDWEERDLSFFDALTGKSASLLRFHDLKHGDFASVIIRFFVHTQPDGDRDLARIDIGYATFCRYLLAFLDAHLKAGTAAQTFLAEAPESHGIPKGVVSIERH